ncbi:MAG: hypothetical protein A2085_05065 [Gemmatimonadetes bacterium GWC2_71_10]|nr:MAG: hypothetical protein A2085_05065 [Gemmatimonadetes bacterium GWC2_71_10]
MLAPFVVTLLGSDGRPYDGADVTWAVVGGSGTVAPSVSTTDADGLASAVLTLGTSYGVVTVQASTRGVTPRVFSATSIDPCDYATSHTLGSTSAGALSTLDCQLNDGSYIDFYTVAIGAQGIRIDQAAGFDTFLFLFGATGAIVGVDDDGGDGSNSLIRAILPAGTYDIGANSYASGVTGAYTITSSTISSSATGCLEYWVTRGLQASSQSLSTTDCPASGSYGDVFSIYLAAGQALTVRQSSTAIDAYLGLVNANNVVVASDDDSGGGTDALFTYTPSSAGIYYIVATSFVTGQTGAYTLTIQ